MDGFNLSYQHPRSGEWAHDVRDPLREALWVSIEPAWELRPPQAGCRHSWLEIGFGRGMVSAVALRELARRNVGAEHILVHGAEPNPDWLQPWPTVLGSLAPYSPWWGEAQGMWQLADPTAEIRVVAEAAPECFQSGLQGGTPGGYDWIFLDLFSPAKHAEDWRPGLLEALTEQAAPGAVLTSYCCARSLREALAALGWQVERLRRPAFRDTLRAQLAHESPHD